MKMRINFFHFLLISFAILFNSFYLGKALLSSKETTLEDLQEEENNKTISEPIFSLESGYYNVDEIKELKLTSDNTIFYTLDSSDPKTSQNAIIYTKPIKMYDRSSEPNVYGRYQYEEDSPYSIQLQAGFKAGNYSFDKITVIRAVSQGENGEFSKTVTKVYVIMNSEKLEFYSEFPLVSIVTDPANLFDKDIGIYVVGQQYIDWKNSEEYDPNKSIYDKDNKANFYMKGKEWEREAIVTYFENKTLGFSQGMGIRIKGSAARADKFKSFNVFAKKKYEGGKGKIEYELFEDNFSYNDGRKIKKYDSIGLRTVSTSRMRENFIENLIKNSKNVANFNNRRCMVFLDGELWGMYDITERASTYYFLTNYGVPEDSVSMIKSGQKENGPDSDIDDVHGIGSYCKKNNLSISENYKYVTDKIDVDSIIEHYALALYLVLWDWPNYNYLMWRNNGKKIEGNPYSDGKWRFGSFDWDKVAGISYKGVDAADQASHDFFQKIEEKKNGFPTSIFVGLLSNEEFKNKFIKYFTSLAEDVFEPTKMTELIDQSEEKYYTYIALNNWRWRSIENSKDKTFEKHAVDVHGWIHGEFEKMKDFFVKRPEYAIKHMKSYLGIEN